MRIRTRIRKLGEKLKKEVKTPVYIPVLEGNILMGKTVLITGGAGGIGYAIASECLRNGASVVLGGRDYEKLLKAKQQLSEHIRNTNQRIIPLVIDVMEIASVRTTLNKLLEDNSLEKIDVLVNNAGVSAGAAIGNTKEEDYDKVIDTNLKGTYFMAQEFSNYLIENKIHGNILNVSSVSGIRPVITPYMLSKWGITGLTEGLAKKLIKYDIVVNGIAPGPTATEMLRKDGTDLMYASSPAKRYADPIEIANLAVFLISDMGRMIIGDIVYITGGCGNLTVDDINY